MFFLLRMAFWLGLVLVLLPRDEAPAANGTQDSGLPNTVSAATAAVLGHESILAASTGLLPR